MVRHRSDRRSFPAAWPRRRRPSCPLLTVGLAGAAAVQLAMSRAAAADRAANPGGRDLSRMGFRAGIEWIYVVPQILAGLFAHPAKSCWPCCPPTVVAEWVFHRPGAADLFVKSVALRDWNMAGVIMLVFASLTLIADFLGRCAAHALDQPGYRQMTDTVTISPVGPSLAACSAPLAGSAWADRRRGRPERFSGDCARRRQRNRTDACAAVGSLSVRHRSARPRHAERNLHGLSMTGAAMPGGARCVIRRWRCSVLSAARLSVPLALTLRGVAGVLAAMPALLLAVLVIGLTARFCAGSPPDFGRPAGLRARLRPREGADDDTHSEYARATGLSRSDSSAPRSDLRIPRCWFRPRARALAAVTIILSTLSFLGFGAEPPARDLGLMIAAAKALPSRLVDGGISGPRADDPHSLRAARGRPGRRRTAMSEARRILDFHELTVRRGDVLELDGFRLRWSGEDCRAWRSARQGSAAARRGRLSEPRQRLWHARFRRGEARPAAGAASPDPHRLSVHRFRALRPMRATFRS